MKDKILKELRKLEYEEGIKILYAVESGSRAWGFASINSDYDVRFIYMRNKFDYLRLEGFSDTIERVSGDLDLSGWDITKALKLLKNSNPTLFDWFKSPIVYYKDSKFDKVIEVSNKYFSKRKVILHHYNLAKRYYNDFIMDNEKVRVKKYFYILKSIGSAYYILDSGDIPPVEFDALRKFFNSDINKIIDKLLDIKTNHEEIAKIDRIKALDEYIIKAIDEIGKITKDIYEYDDKNMDELNSIFLELLN